MSRLGGSESIAGLASVRFVAQPCIRVELRDGLKVPFFSRGNERALPRIVATEFAIVFCDGVNPEGYEFLRMYRAISRES